MNLDYKRSKIHILGQLNYWQVWQQGLEFVLLFLFCWFSAFVFLDLDS